jgi:hypothetical protein
LSSGDLRLPKNKCEAGLRLKSASSKNPAIARKIQVSKKFLEKSRKKT